MRCLAAILDKVRSRSSYSRVHFVDVALEPLARLRALQLERRGDQTVLHGEQFVAQANRSDLLESLQAGVVPRGDHALQHVSFHAFIGAQIFKAHALEFGRLRGRPRHQDFLIRDDDGDEVRLKGVAVDEGLCDKLVAGVDVFNLFRRHVLALSQLEDVLCSIDNFY